MITFNNNLQNIQCQTQSYNRTQSQITKCQLQIFPIEGSLYKIPVVSSKAAPHTLKWDSNKRSTDLIFNL